MPGSTVTAGATDHHRNAQLAAADADWFRDAACRGLGWLMDPAPKAWTPELQQQARDLCDSCPIFQACRAWVLDLPEALDPGGICAGLTEKERADHRATDRSRFKTCTNCRDTKVRSDFYADSRNRDGLQSWCKPCVRAAVNASKGRTNGASTK